MDLTAIGAGIAAFTGVGAGIGIGVATAKAADKIRPVLILGCALAEGTAIFGMVVGLLLIFAS